MGKYSAPVTFAGQRRAGSAASEQRPAYSKTDWAKEIDERIDIVQAIWEYTGVDLRKLKGSRRQLNGKCPYPGCSSKDDAFIVWPHRSPTSKNHYHCRRCDSSGDIIKLLEDINGWGFGEVLEKLGLQDISAQPPKPRYESPEQAKQRAFDERARQQLEMLRHEYACGRMQTALTMYERPQQYLAERGIPVNLVQPYGLGYIPAPQESGKPPHKDLWRWQGRIIFPLYGPDGLTFAGRTLALWQPGMSPAEHKWVIEEYNATHLDRPPIIRVLKTSPCGYFGYRGAVAGNVKRLVFPEGEFDALSLMLAGIEGVIAVGTAGLPMSLIPLSAESAIVASDADVPGKQAIGKLTLDMERAGLEVRQVLPTAGKDWNDMLTAGQAETIRALFRPPPSTAEISSHHDKAMAGATECERAWTDADYEAEIVAYVAANPPLCATCLGTGMQHGCRETVELAEPGPDGFMYCPEHHPSQHRTLYSSKTS